MSRFIASESANGHLIDTLNLHGNQYNLILSIFFVPYVLTAPFLGLLGKKIGPNIVLPCMMLIFGICTILVVAVFNFSGLFAIRWFLGMAESAFFPLVIYYQTTLVFPASIILSNPFFLTVLLIQLLPSWRISPSTRNLLRSPKHRLCLLRFTCLWRISH